MKWYHVVTVGCITASLVLPVMAEEEKESDETTVTQAELPPAVAATVKEFGMGGEFDHAVKGDEDGVAVYEVVVKKGDKKIEVQTTLDGVLNMREEKIDASELPKAVAERAVSKGSKIKSAERTVRTVYEITVTSPSGKDHELTYTPGAQTVKVFPVKDLKATKEKGEKGEKAEGKDAKAEKKEKGEKGEKAEKGEKGEKGEKE